MEKNIYIDFTHICENVIDAKNGNLSLINIFNQITSSNFPAVYSQMYVVVGGRGIKGEYPVSIKIENKTTGKIVVREQVLPNKIIIPEDTGEGRLYIKFSPLILETEGKYEIMLSIEGESKNLFFDVKSSK
ncbi:MAG: hypothetical protein WC694_00930 [Candidatus Paceibacterota bacterium]|jgi:hypothetical protein